MSAHFIVISNTCIFINICMANFILRANICTYFKNGSPLVSSAQNIDILSGSNRSGVMLDTHSKFIRDKIIALGNRGCRL